ncbi:UNVERIFIED_CONTAM: hypothetical protein NCL1_39907 [Trichonephila clavipes]
MNRLKGICLSAVNCESTHRVVHFSALKCRTSFTPGLFHYKLLTFNGDKVFSNKRELHCYHVFFIEFANSIVRRRFK